MSEIKARAEDRPVTEGAQATVGKVKRIATAGIALGAVAVFSVGLWFAYDQGIKKGQKGAPPVIRAEGPTKVVPAEPGGMQVPNQDKQIYDRLANNTPTSVERVLPPPERPLPATGSQGANMARPAAPSNGVQTLPIPSPPQAPPPAPARQVASPPAKAPDAASAAGAAAPAPPPASAPAAPAASAALPDQPSAAEAPKTATPPATQVLTPARPVAAAQPAPRANTQTAAAPSAAPAVRTGSGNFKVQVSAQRDQAAAQAAWTKVQRKLPDVLGGITPTYERVDLGEKGIYFRVQAGPFPDRAAAQAACDRLKAVGEGCIIVGR